MITIVPYQTGWPGEFQVLGTMLRNGLGDLALRIDHIGSTAVPGLQAKDRIDIQVTVAALVPAVEQALAKIGYARLEHIAQDHTPPGSIGSTDDWVKWFFAPPPTQRPTNLHVRIEGRANQRYALLFRDYLRTHSDAARAYGQVKAALAGYHTDDVDAYYAVKDPVCDIIVAGAETWATAAKWRPGQTDS